MFCKCKTCDFLNLYFFEKNCKKALTFIPWTDIILKRSWETRNWIWKDGWAGLRRTTGNRVGPIKPSRVRIPFFPPQKSYIQFGCSFFVLQFYMLSVRPFLWHNKATKGAELIPEIIPIRDLKNTNAISQRCHETQEPIFVTKSGYGDMVIMSIRAPRMLSGEFLFMATPHNSRLAA